MKPIEKRQLFEKEKAKLLRQKNVLEDRIRILRKRNNDLQKDNSRINSIANKYDDMIFRFGLHLEWHKNLYEGNYKTLKMTKDGRSRFIWDKQDARDKQLNAYAYGV